MTTTKQLVSRRKLDYLINDANNPPACILCGQADLSLETLQCCVTKRKTFVFFHETCFYEEVARSWQARRKQA